jgi:hypothetical protein
MPRYDVRDAVCTAATMVYEWKHWPDGSPLLGPLGIIWYNGFDGEGFVLCVISVALVFTFFLKPHAVTTVLFLLGILNWLFWGIMAQGIGC